MNADTFVAPIRDIHDLTKGLIPTATGFETVNIDPVTQNPVESDNHLLWWIIGGFVLLRIIR
jgi:hypothetical protein